MKNRKKHQRKERPHPKKNGGGQPQIGGRVAITLGVVDAPKTGDSFDTCIAIAQGPEKAIAKSHSKNGDANVECMAAKKKSGARRHEG